MLSNKKNLSKFINLMVINQLNFPCCINIFFLKNKFTDLFFN